MLVTKRTKINRTTTHLLPLAAITVLLALTAPVFARRTPQNQARSEMKAMKVPETAKDHQEMAEHYQKIEAQANQEIEMHKQMLTDFNKSVATNPKSGENPYSKQMRLHCEQYIKAEENLAGEAASSAKFHTHQAKELEGK